MGFLDDLFGSVNHTIRAKQLFDELMANTYHVDLQILDRSAPLADQEVIRTLDDMLRQVEFAASISRDPDTQREVALARRLRPYVQRFLE